MKSDDERLWLLLALCRFVVGLRLEERFYSENYLGVLEGGMYENGERGEGRGRHDRDAALDGLDAIHGAV